METLGVSRRSWARWERRARCGHERDVMRRVRALADDASPVLRISTTDGLDAIRIELPGCSIVLAGVALRTLDVAAQLGASPALALVDVGRYQRRWWLAITDGQQRRHLAAAHLKIVPRDGRRDLHRTAAPDGSLAYG